jgi:hypothetical protein
MFRTGLKTSTLKFQTLELAILQYQCLVHTPSHTPFRLCFGVEAKCATKEMIDLLDPAMLINNHDILIVFYYLYN